MVAEQAGAGAAGVHAEPLHDITVVSLLSKVQSGPFSLGSHLTVELGQGNRKQDLILLALLRWFCTKYGLNMH